MCFELEAAGWYGSIRLVEAVLTKLVANSGNTGKSKMAAKFEKRQTTYFTVFFIYGVGGMGGAFTITAPSYSNSRPSNKSADTLAGVNSPGTAPIREPRPKSMLIKSEGSDNMTPA